MASTPLLGLSLPADGTTNWGTLVNTSITALLDSAVAGTTTLSSDADVTLTATTEATNQARQAILLCTGARAAVRTITAPAQSKTYVIINATSGSYGVKIVGVGPTTGITVPNGKAYMVAWNGSDFVAIGTTTVNLATDVTGTLPITNGGTGQTTQQNAINALAGSVTASNFLRGDGTNVTMSYIQPNDLPYATDTTRGATKLITGVAYTGSIVAPTTDPNRMYGLQADAVGTGVVNVPWTDTTYGTATSTVQGLIKLGSNTAQTVAANSVTATASRTYALQLNASGQGVVNVPWSDTVYTLPAATISALGGIKLGDATVQATAANTVTATASRSYALQVNASGQGLVNVPWTDTVYSLPTATTTVLGGIKLGSDTAQATAANAVTATASRSYALQLTSGGNAVVNVPWTDTVYSLPTATTTVLGGIKLGSDTAQSTAANAVTSTASRTYALQLDATGNAVVNVPWTDTNSGGTVTSVAGTGTVSGLTLSGTVTTSGNITLGGTLAVTPSNFAAQTANYVLAGPTTGSAAAPTFRALVASDIPTLNQNTTGNAATATNISGGAANQIVAQSGASTTTFLTAPTVATTFLMWNGSAFTWSTVTPATGTVFASDISVNSLTVGRGNSGLITSTTVGYQASAAATASNVQQTAIGYRALATATATLGVGFEYEGSTAIGYKALESSNPNILSSNTAVGAGALTALTTGGLNTAVGAGAGFSITNGNGATAIGTYAANLATNGSFVAVGYGTLRNALSRIAGSVAVGSEALLKATTYSGNSAIYNENNTAIGHNALYNLSAEDSTLAGSSNTALGRSAGSALVSGSNNMMLGSGAQGSTTSISNEITLGNSSITTLRCQVTSITSLSDQRDKYDIEDLPLGLSFINALRPRRYKWDKRDWYVDEIQHEDGTVETVTVPKDGSRAQTDWNEGFVAQEAKAALQAAGADWFPLVYESNPEKLEMSSGKLIPVLVKAIQELTARLEALEAK